MSETTTKPWYASKSIWGALVAVLASIAGAIWGLDLSAENQEAIVGAITGIVGALGGAYAIYGRVKADAKLTK
jgi:hypothetical protein